MWSIISNFFIQFLDPLALVAAVLFISLFLIKKHPKTAIWFVAISLVVISVFGNIFFSAFLTRSMEWRYMPSQQIEPADAILLLAAGTENADTPRQRVELQDSADRVLYAAMYYQQELAPIIIVSGNSERAFSAKTLLMELGVPEDAIVVNADSSNLRDDISNSLDIITEREIESILLVTSALKMDRTLFLLRNSGLAVTPAPCDYQVTLRDWQNLTNSNWRTIITQLLPTSAALEQTFNVLWEYFGLAYYRLRSIF